MTLLVWLACTRADTEPEVLVAAQTPRADFDPVAFDDIILDFMERWDVPGAVVAVSRDERLVLSRGYGIADLESGRPVAASDRGRIASISKSITATAVMFLVEHGDLDLDESAFAILADLEAPEGSDGDPRIGDITVRHLLTHSGGWDSAASGDPMYQVRWVAESLGVPSPPEPESVIRLMLGQPLDFEPGSRYAYSNFGYLVLGQIIERRSGQDYHQFVHDAVFGPAPIQRMEQGRSLPGERPRDELAYHPYPGQGTAWSVFGDGTDVVPWPDGGFHMEVRVGHGSWIASAPDLLRFMAAVDGQPNRPDVISADSRGLMLARPELEHWRDGEYWAGMGWFVRPAGSSANVWHNGSFPGSRSTLVHAHTGLAWAVILNRRSRDSSGLGKALSTAMWDAVGAVEAWPEELDLFDTVP